MMRPLFLRVRRAAKQCRSPVRPWQRSGRALCFLGAALLAVATPAQADTAAGLAYMKDGDYIKAMGELIPAAQGGDARAQVNLASIYYYGLGIAANFDKAFLWYHAAAIQGDPDGQIGLAILYMLGQGVQTDPAIAYMWLTLALDRLPPGYDHNRVSENRDYIGAHMSAAQLQEATGLVQHWYHAHQAP